MENGAHGWNDGGKGAFSSYNKFFRTPAELGAKQVRFRTRLFFERAVMNIAHHTDDLKICATDNHDAAHWVQTMPKSARHGFIDDGDFCRSIQGVTSIKLPSRVQWYPHGLEVGGIHDPGKRFVTRPIGFTLCNNCPTTVATERQAVAQAGGFHTRRARLR